MLPSQENCGGGAENPKPLIMACSFQWPFLSQDPPRVALLEQRHSCHPANERAFRSCVRAGVKDQILEQKMFPAPFDMDHF